MLNKLLRTITSEWRDWYRSFLSAVPGEIGCRLRNLFYGYHAAAGCRVLRGVVIYFPERLVLGRNIAITADTQLNAAGGINIGDDTMIGPGCLIWSVNHRFQDREVPIRTQGYDPQRVVIGRDCWIAARSVILPGVQIGDGSVVAAGSVVTQSCEPGSVLVGVPAKVIRMRGQ